MSTHPMVDIRFLTPIGEFERHWYHLPRVDEVVVLALPDGHYLGRVEEVTWLDAVYPDTPHVEVRLR